MSYIVVYFYNSKGILFITLVLLFPLLLLPTVFFIEIIFYHYVFIFIKLLMLLIIPLILRLVIYIAKMYCTTYLNYIRSFLEFFTYENEPQIYMKLKPEFENSNSKISLQACEAYYEIYINIKQFCEALEQKRNKIKPYIMLYYSSFFILSWLYIILYSFNFFLNIYFINLIKYRNMHLISLFFVPVYICLQPFIKYYFYI